MLKKTFSLDLGFWCFSSWELMSGLLVPPTMVCWLIVTDATAATSKVVFPCQCLQWDRIVSIRHLSWYLESIHCVNPVTYHINEHLISQILINFKVFWNRSPKNKATPSSVFLAVPKETCRWCNYAGQFLGHKKAAEMCSGKCKAAMNLEPTCLVAWEKVMILWPSEIFTLWRSLSTQGTFMPASCCGWLPLDETSS